MKVTIIECDLCEMGGKEPRTVVARYRDSMGRERDICHEHLELIKEACLEYWMLALEE